MTGALLALTTLALIAAGLLVVIRRRFPASSGELIDAIDALLPQTQCAQCGYPGCRPYAAAVAAGAELDLCPPGGASTQQALSRLLGRPAGTAVTAPGSQVAVIDESRCIGCYLCIEACPVDAIVGAPQLMHTVLEAHCTGCELCVEPCPVDCIELRPTGTPALPAPPPAAASESCIRCNRCQAVCPPGLQPELLWWACRSPTAGSTSRHGLDSCIECGLCNQVCPAGIDLLATFTAARADQARERKLEQMAQTARTRHEQREARLAAEQLIISDRRSQRLRSSKRTW